METATLEPQKSEFALVGFIIMTEIKDQAIIVRDLLGSHKEKKNHIRGEMPRAL